MFLLALTACSKAEPMLGTVLTAADPAPPLQLTDQFGQTVALSDYRGKVVVLAFLYTYCPDICPIVASHLKQAHQMLGDQAAQVGFVAISVDPERDTVERVHAYLDERGVLDDWTFLVGGQEELSPIWQAYYIAPTVDDQPAAEATPHSGEEDTGGVHALQQDLAVKYTVSHAAPVYLIDREGVMRVLFTLPFDPDDLVHDIRLLLE